jgi:hypothetical protein
LVRKAAPLIGWAGIDRFEVGNSVDAEHHGLAVDDKLLRPVLQRGFDNRRVSAAPVMTVASKQPDAVASAAWVLASAHALSISLFGMWRGWTSFIFNFERKAVRFSSG